MAEPAAAAATALLDWAWQAGVVAGVALLLDRLGARLPATLRRAALLVALGRFAVPPGAMPELGLVAPGAGPVSSLAAANGPAAGGGSLATLLVLAALGGAAGMALRLARALATARRLRAAGRPAPLPLLALLREVAGPGTPPARRLPELRLVDDLAAPCAVGLLRPAILVPSALAARLDGASLAAVLAHELAHLRQRDPWVRAALATLALLWWWHPLFWAIDRALARTAEEACDDAALLAARCAPLAYARTLVAAAAAAGPGGACAFAAHPLEGRLRRLGRAATAGGPRRAPRWAVAVTAIALGIVALPSPPARPGDVAALRLSEPVQRTAADAFADHAERHRQSHRAAHGH